MKVVFFEDVEGTAMVGDVKDVKPGFARNFLLPQKKAMRATKNNLQQFETRKAHLVAENLKRREEASAVAKKMEGTAVAIVRQAGESGQLYGSVTARDLSDAVTAGGFQINRAQVVIERPIKTTGVHTVRVSLHPEVSVVVRVSVAPTQDEADAHLKGSSPTPAETQAPEAEDDAEQA